MNILIKFVIIIFLASCISQENRWVSPKFNASDFKSVTLYNDHVNTEVDIFSCSKSKFDGVITLNNNSTHHFCIAKKNEKKFAKITTSESHVEICLWKESGFCDDEGMCQSIFSASDCRKF